MNKTRLILTLAALVCGFGPRTAGAQPIDELPYYDNFEIYDELTPLIEGINGWYASSDSVVVQTNTVSIWEGSTKAAVLPIDVTLSNRFDLTAEPVTSVWMKMDISPVLYGGSNPPPIAANASSALFINQDGHFVVHDANSPSTNWVTITHTVTGEPAVPVTQNEWVRLHLYQDYNNKTWTLFANHIMLLDDIRFFDTNLATFAGFDLFNGNIHTSYVDNVAVTVAMPEDLAEDGGNWLPTLNVSETEFTRTVPEGQEAKTNTFLIWKTSGYEKLDVAFTNTITYEPGSGTDWLSIDISEGTSTGDLHTITVSYHTSNLDAREDGYVAYITTDAKETRFGSTAKDSPHVITVTVNVLDDAALVVDPTELSQDVDKGGNPTNQSFQVWNATDPPVVPMYFTMEKTEPWLALSKPGGVVTGQAAHTVGVMFSDMSGFDMGTYEDTITVRAWGDTGDGVISGVQTNFVTVSVEIVGPPPPLNVWVSTNDTEKAVVSWDAAPGITRYEVWRGDTFDLDYALKLAEVGKTSHNDRSAFPGRLYYYWVRSVSDYGVAGNASDRASGYRALSSPGGLFASAGTYTDRVRVTWSASTGADSYELHRGVLGGSATKVFHASGLSYNDTQVEPGVKYVYRAKAKNSRYSSALSIGNTGYVLSPPSNVSAGKGTHVERVRVSWNAADAATGYQVWRSKKVDLLNRAVMIGRTTGTEFYDTDVEVGEVYYYWVKSWNATATTGFSRSDSGYAASGAVDLSVRQLVLQPDEISMGGNPSVVSFRMYNEGGLSMVSPDTAVKIEFYASVNPRFGNNAVLIGRTTRDITLSAGGSTVVIVDGSIISMPAEAGEYYIFVKVNPVYPSRLVDTNQDNNITMRRNPVRVIDAETVPYRAINDYSGDGISDLVVVYNGFWNIRSVDGRIIGENIPWGGPGFQPVSGDFNGDGIADLAVYGHGMWFARNIAGQVVLWAEPWGGDGLVPVYGVFGGADSTKADLAVYNEHTGAWYIRTADGRIILWDVYFVDEGYTPVSGDYSGDGIWDLAVYHEPTGTWYARSLDDELLFWAENWGGPDFQPVSGDFNGNGLSDIAVYYKPLGLWFARSVEGHVVLWNQEWGGPDFQPVSGDYTGDGRSDLAVYHEASGKWFIRSVDGNIVLWDSAWGGPGYKPVGR